MGRSRLTKLPTPNCFRFVRLRVSGETSAVNCRWPFSTTVRQAPFTAMLAPISIAPTGRFVFTISRAVRLLTLRDAIFPTSSISPVNMALLSSFLSFVVSLEIPCDQYVRSRSLDLHPLDPQRLFDPPDSQSVNHR